MKKPDKKALDEFLTRRADRIIDEKEIRKLLTSGKKLTIKFGVDVTSPDIHIGHGVNLWMLRQLQDWGHKVVFLIGGFTTKIGDPTGRDITRKEISDKDIQKNAKKYIDQVGKILLTNKTVFEVKNNNDWFGHMPTSEFLKLLAQITHAQLIERDMFQKRLKEGKEIRMHEMIYPIVQGYDSVILRDEIVLCGTDQLFNEMMGRFFQERFKQKPQAIITGKILVGTDGHQKMSKSLDNYIGVTDSPKDQYGKAMSIADSAILDYFQLATTISTKELADITKLLAQKVTNPRDLKMRLAHTIVTLYHGAKAADTAQAEFVKTFQKHEAPTDIPTTTITKPTSLIDILLKHKFVASGSEARRLIQQNGIKLNGQPVTDINLVIKQKTDALLQVGKRRFLKFK